MRVLSYWVWSSIVRILLSFSLEVEIDGDLALEPLAAPDTEAVVGAYRLVIASSSAQVGERSCQAAVVKRRSAVASAPGGRWGRGDNKESVDGAITGATKASTITTA